MIITLRFLVAISPAQIIYFCLKNIMTSIAFGLKYFFNSKKFKYSLGHNYDI